MSKISSAALGLSTPRCREVIGYAGRELPEFAGVVPTDIDPRQMVTDLISTYIARADKDERYRQQAVEKLLGFVTVSKAGRRKSMPPEIPKTILPICIDFVSRRQKEDEERTAAFLEYSEPYANLVEFIVESAKQSPPRFTKRTAKGLLLSFGLAVATDHLDAAAAATAEARGLLKGKLVRAHFEAEASANDEAPKDLFHREFQEGIGFIERLIGCTSNGMRLGYRQLNEPELFDDLLDSEVKKGRYGDPDLPESLAAAEEYVSRRVGYVLDTLL